jgi:hypothetical protein
MKTRHRPTRLMLLEAISQNCSTVATALRRRAATGNRSEMPRHSEATTTSMTRVLGAFLLTLCVSFAPRAVAVEGGVGRPISGMSIAPYAGVISPEPGFAFATGETYYEGSIGGGRTVPVAGLLVANVDMKASFTPLSLLYIWPTSTKEWNFASAVSFPLAWLEVEANISLGPFTVRKKDSTFGLFDLVFTPIAASHHFSQTESYGLQFHILGSDRIVRKGQIGQPEPEHLDVISGVAYTKILPIPNIELTGIWQMEFYTQNPATHFQNGILSDLEALQSNDSKTASASGLSRAGFSRSTTTKAHRPRSTAFSGARSALAPSLPTSPSWVKATWILVRARSTILISASASGVTPLTLAPA